MRLKKTACEFDQLPPSWAAFFVPSTFQIPHPQGEGENTGTGLLARLFQLPFN
jgi:hypothetical protein